MSVTLKWTTPTKRQDGSALALTDISGCLIFRNGSNIANVSPVAGLNTFTDNAAPTGADDYTVITRTNDGLQSAASNDSSVTVPAPAPTPTPAATITDLQATLT